MDKSDIGLELIKAKWQEANDDEREQILSELKHRSLSIIEAIIALRSSGFFSLGEAKEYISASPAWHKEVENGKALQEIAWQVLDDFNESQRQQSHSQ